MKIQVIYFSILRLKRKSYKPLPAKRVYIPKNEKEKRPLGLPALENKIETETGEQKIIPQRTNNIIEQMFRELTRANKRKTGDASIGRTIKGIVADTPLIRNLKDEKYMEMILREKEKIEEVFAEVDVKIIRKKLREHQIYNEKLPAKIKILLQKGKEFDILSIIK